MARSDAREAAMQLIYARTLGGDEDPMTLPELTEIIWEQDDLAYVRDILDGTRARGADIDEQILTFSRGWTISRMPRVDLSILRLAVYEMLYREDIPLAVSVNEAVELSRKYSTEEAGPFINGVLGGIGRAERVSV